jgi:adenylate kinase
MHIIFYGSEGSGKTTQAKLLAEKLTLPHIISGDIVRKYATSDRGLIGDVCRKALKEGKYVDDLEMFVLWKHRLSELDTQKGWVIDGFPRTQDQIKFLEEKMKSENKKVDIVFYLELKENVAIERLLKRGRRNPDGTLHDTPEIIKKRLQMYKKQEKNVLDFYKQKGILKLIDGSKSIEEIHQNILRCL